jgi:hypothetical protein
MAPEPSANPGTSSPSGWGMWRRILTGVPTLFGQIHFMASLRDSSGRYSHPTLVSALGPGEADKALRLGHYRLFENWICLTLEEQKADLEEFVGPGRGLQAPLSYRDLPPAGAREVERQLYLADLETLLELLDASRNADEPLTPTA